MSEAKTGTDTENPERTNLDKEGHRDRYRRRQEVRTRNSQVGRDRYSGGLAAQVRDT